MNVSNKHRTSQCYGSRPQSAERGTVEGGNLAWRGLGLRNRGCAQRVCTVGVHRGEVVYLLVCFALIKLHSVFIIHNFLQKFCRLPFYYVREVCVCVGGTCVWMQAPKEIRSMGLPGSWSCRQLWASPLECWEPSSASPEKHWMFFTVEPSLQHLISLKVKEKKKPTGNHLERQTAYDYKATATWFCCFRPEESVTSEDPFHFELRC